MIMKRFAAVMGLFAGLTLSASAPASAEGVFEVCKKEINAYCSQVEPRAGCLFACFYAHEDKLSDACEAAVVDVADHLGMFFETVRYVTQEWGEDIQKHCTGVEQGGGRILSCLVKAGDGVSDSCKAVITRIRLPEE